MPQRPLLRRALARVDRLLRADRHVASPAATRPPTPGALAPHAPARTAAPPGEGVTPVHPRHAEGVLATSPIRFHASVYHTGQCPSRGRLAKVASTGDRAGWFGTERHGRPP